MDRNQVVVEIDTYHQVAYLTLSTNAISQTVEFSDSIIVDLDEYRVAVGIEILGLSTTIPLTELAQRFHIRSEQLPIINSLLPTLSYQLRAKFAPDSRTSARVPIPA